ncbi:hypothetical protein Tco_0976900 [Tanacetum coccineum]|uniref:Uncharacterized protein n=1 Tax=Tanacetum coccineum TaxID=301880 RepID=A0ABQ5EIK8_9ASTR
MSIPSRPTHPSRDSISHSTRFYVRIPSLDTVVAIDPMRFFCASSLLFLQQRSIPRVRNNHRIGARRSCPAGTPVPQFDLTNLDCSLTTFVPCGQLSCSRSLSFLHIISLSHNTMVRLLLESIRIVTISTAVKNRPRLPCGASSRAPVVARCSHRSSNNPTKRPLSSHVYRIMTLAVLFRPHL